MSPVRKERASEDVRVTVKRRDVDDPELLRKLLAVLDRVLDLPDAPEDVRDE